MHPEDGKREKEKAGACGGFIGVCPLSGKAINVNFDKRRNVQ